MAVTFLTNEDEKKYVKTINDTAPDENGNIVVKGEGIAYDNTVSGIDATTVQGAIDKLSGGNADCLLTVETITVGEPSEPGNVPATGIVLDYSTISLNAGESVQLAASVTPGNATNTAIIWESSNNGIATVNNGLVTAVASGSCTITAKSAENSSIKATCTVAVAADSGGDGGGTDGKVQLATLGYVADTLFKKDGTPVALSGGNYVAIPYTDGVQISTGMNAGWIGGYPPVVVYDGGVYAVPEYTTGGHFSVSEPSGPNIVAAVTNYTCTLSGYSEVAKVYVNFYMDMGNEYAVEAMTTVDKYWYIPGGAE